MLWVLNGGLFLKGLRAILLSLSQTQKNDHLADLLKCFIGGNVCTVQNKNNRCILGAQSIKGFSQKVLLILSEEPKKTRTCPLLCVAKLPVKLPGNFIFHPVAHSSECKIAKK